MDSWRLRTLGGFALVAVGVALVLAGIGASVTEVVAPWDGFDEALEEISRTNALCVASVVAGVVSAYAGIRVVARGLHRRSSSHAGP
jgi:hypothetical protein